MNVYIYQLTNYISLHIVTFSRPVNFQLYFLIRPWVHNTIPIIPSVCVCVYTFIVYIEFAKWRNSYFNISEDS